MKRAKLLFLRWVWQHISTLLNHCCVAERATDHLFNYVSSGFGTEQNLPLTCLGSCALHGLDNATLVTDCYHSYPFSVSAGPFQVPHPADESDRWGSTASPVTVLHTHPGVCNEGVNESGKWNSLQRCDPSHLVQFLINTILLPACRLGWILHVVLLQQQCPWRLEKKRLLR